MMIERPAIFVNFVEENSIDSIRRLQNIKAAAPWLCSARSARVFLEKTSKFAFRTWLDVKIYNNDIGVHCRFPTRAA